ncbi:MAG: hypothetical protein WC238_04725 [Parcubacteria group bacterium]|jgi:hypothetical protein
MRTKTIFAVLSLFLMTMIAMPPSGAGITQQEQVSVTQTMQTVDVMEAFAYEMTPTITMQCPWMGYEPEQAQEEIIFVECLQIQPISPEASPTDFVRLWYTHTQMEPASHSPTIQHLWQC